jgi:hypothetical protein
LFTFTLTELVARVHLRVDVLHVFPTLAEELRQRGVGLNPRVHVGLLRGNSFASSLLLHVDSALERRCLLRSRFLGGPATDEPTYQPHPYLRCRCLPHSYLLDCDTGCVDPIRTVIPDRYT